jgi:hypothetical protein
MQRHVTEERNPELRIEVLKWPTAKGTHVHLA